jgi:hypothetical protein
VERLLVVAPGWRWYLVERACGLRFPVGHTTVSAGLFTTMNWGQLAGPVAPLAIYLHRVLSGISIRVVI